MSDPIQEVPGAVAQFLDDVADRARVRARDRVGGLRRRYPDSTRRELADRLVKSFSRRAGLGGAATGALSLLSLPLGLPAGVALTLGIEAELLLALLELYDVDTSGSAGRVKLYALWAGSGLADAAKSVGLVMGADALGVVLAGTLPARLIGRLNPALVKLVLRRLGLGWMPKVMKLWPIIGAPIGYVVDSTALRTLGIGAIATLESVVAAKAADAAVVEAPVA